MIKEAIQTIEGLVRQTTSPTLWKTGFGRWLAWNPSSGSFETQEQVTDRRMDVMDAWSFVRIVKYLESDDDASGKTPIFISVAPDGSLTAVHESVYDDPKCLDTVVLTIPPSSVFRLLRDWSCGKSLSQYDLIVAVNTVLQLPDVANKFRDVKLVVVDDKGALIEAGRRREISSRAVQRRVMGDWPEKFEVSFRPFIEWGGAARCTVLVEFNWENNAFYVTVDADLVRGVEQNAVGEMIRNLVGLGMDEDRCVAGSHRFMEVELPRKG